MFPKWMYHPTHGGRIFSDPSELAAVDGWCESPADAGLVASTPVNAPGEMQFTRVDELPPAPEPAEPAEPVLIKKPQGAPDAPMFEAATSQDALDAGRKGKTTAPKTPAQQRAAVAKARPH